MEIEEPFVDEIAYPLHGQQLRTQYRNPLPRALQQQGAKRLEAFRAAGVQPDHSHLKAPCASGLQACAAHLPACSLERGKKVPAGIAWVNHEQPAGALRYIMHVRSLVMALPLGIAR